MPPRPTVGAVLNSPAPVGVRDRVSDVEPRAVAWVLHRVVRALTPTAVALGACASSHLRVEGAPRVPAAILVRGDVDVCGRTAASPILVVLCAPADPSVVAGWWQRGAAGIWVVGTDSLVVERRNRQAEVLTVGLVAVPRRKARVAVADLVPSTVVARRRGDC